MDSNSEIQGYNFYPMLHFRRKFSSSVTPPKLVIIEGEEEFEVEKILNKQVVQGKEKFLVWWKGYTAEGDTWESRENLENAKELVEEFEREYGEETEELRRQELEEEEKEFSWELPKEFTAKLLYG